ncbi:MAG TPA: cytochrome c biogenesis protein CcdA [Moheibacter sp.]|nr:cytochrome c biogenesis protein CcdA [Moheibacter sp.]
MKKRTLFFLLFVPFLLNAQVLTPVKWSTETKDLGNNEYEVLLHAKIDAGWHMYSQQHPGDGIGVPATITFEENANVQTIGKTQEIGKLLDKYSELFMQQEKYYENKVTFKQKVKLKNPKETTVKFSAETQVCDAEKCLPPDWQDFSVKITPKVPEKEDVTENNTEEKKEENPETPVVTVTEEIQDSLNIVQNELNESKDSLSITSNNNIETAIPIEKDSKENKGLWEIFILGVGGGLLALVMPCIFPMIPLTVSLFTKQSKSRSQGIVKALIYGLSIVVIFVALACLATLIFGASALNEFSTNPWVNIAFFVIFVFFAISFFGAFEIALPASWANYTDKQADRGGYIGIFFMAFTLVIISFSCTLPIIGSLATQASTTGNYYALIVGSLGFSVTLAIPFVLFAIFPSWINSLPRSGGWMNTVKVSLGFIELAFAFKFLSNADLVWQAHMLEREVFLAIWIAIFGLMGLYLLGKFRLPHDSPEDRIGIPRLFFSILTFTFVMYMIPGMWGAPVNILSGLTPPIQYAESPNGVGKESLSVGNAGAANELIKGQKYGPHQIPAFLDMADAIEHSKKVKKPIMIDFTGHACANCRKVEERVWSNPEVKNLLINEVVLVSLYVDERTELPKEEQIYSEALGRNLKTVGNKWTAFEIEKYQNNAQPYYIIVDENLNNYNEPLGAIYDVNEYLKWMKKGINGYKAKN